MASPLISRLTLIGRFFTISYFEVVYGRFLARTRGVEVEEGKFSNTPKQTTVTLAASASHRHFSDAPKPKLCFEQLHNAPMNGSPLTGQDISMQ
jgi:hypothetical protein